MRRILRLFITFFALTASAHAADGPISLTVLADPSLALPLTQLARTYTRDNGVAVTVVLTDGHDIAQQIGQGLDANVLITANRALINGLNERGLLDVFGKHTIARTQLALVAPPDIARSSAVAKRISFTAILYAQPKLPLYILPGDTFEGARADALMQTDAYSEAFSARTVIVQNRQALLQKMNEEPGFALLLAADTLNESALKVLLVLPEDVVRPVNYIAVPIAGEAMNASRDFINYLKTTNALMTFSHFGFQPPVEQ